LVTGIQWLAATHNESALRPSVVAAVGTFSAHERVATVSCLLPVACCLLPVAGAVGEGIASRSHPRGNPRGNSSKVDN
jgi:hypothetical protein